MAIAATATAALIRQPARLAQKVGNFCCQLISAVAWPAARLCYSFGISSNLVTCTRFFSPLVFLWLVLNGAPLWQYITAVIVFGYTDAVDGVLAGPAFEEKPHSDLGVMLDPVADKVYLISMYTFHYENFTTLVIITCVGEVLIALLALGYLALSRNGVGKMRASMWGKTKLNLEIATAGLMTWFYATHSPLAAKLALLVGVLVIFFLIGSLFSKVRAVID